MNAVLPFLIVVAALVILILAVLVIVIAGIHASEQRLNLTSKPRTWPEKVARRALGVHSDQPKRKSAPYAETKEVAK